jgi:hypothetical protein
MNFDYSASGQTISASIMHAVRTGGKHIGGSRWGTREIWHVNRLSVPPKGIIRVELLEWNKSVRQAVDLKVNGKIVVSESQHVRLLRTWCDEELESSVEYEYAANDGCITTWNVYMMPRTDQPEMWTVNAAMWYEGDASRRVFHCNAGMTSPPTFVDLVYRISTRPL